MTAIRCKIPLAALAYLLAGSLTPVTPAGATAPVPKVIIGCVTNGKFISADGYHIRPQERGSGEVDLHAFEGRRLRIQGFLLPGDYFILSKPPLPIGWCSKPPA